MAFQPSADGKRATVRKRAVILVSTDRGLCGGLNSNLMREAAKLDQQHHGFHHGRDKRLRSSSRAPSASWRRNSLTRTRRSLPRRGPFPNSRSDLFLKGEVDAVDILFTAFHHHSDAATADGAVSADRQNPGRRRPASNAPAQELPAGGARRTFLNSSRTRKRCWAHCCRTA